MNYVRLFAVNRHPFPIDLQFPILGGDSDGHFHAMTLGPEEEIPHIITIDGEEYFTAVEEFDVDRAYLLHKETYHYIQKNVGVALQSLPGHHASHAIMTSNAVHINPSVPPGMMQAVPQSRPVRLRPDGGWPLHKLTVYNDYPGPIELRFHVKGGPSDGKKHWITLAPGERIGDSYIINGAAYVPCVYSDGKSVGWGFMVYHRIAKCEYEHVSALSAVVHHSFYGDKHKFPKIYDEKRRYLGP